MNALETCRSRARSLVAAAIVLSQLPFAAESHAGGFQAIPARARSAEWVPPPSPSPPPRRNFHRNPALLGACEGTRLTLGAGLIIPEFKFTGVTPVDTETKAEPVFMFPPSFALSFAIDERFGVGLSAGAPFLSRSEWNSAWTGRRLVTSFEHRTSVLTPAAAYSPFDGVSIGVSVPLQFTKHVMTSSVNPSAQSPPGESYSERSKGSPRCRSGFQAGFLASHGIWSVGGSFTMGSDLTIRMRRHRSDPRTPRVRASDIRAARPQSP